MQWFLHKTVKLAQYAQGIGAGTRTDRAVLRLLKHGKQPPVIFDVGANRGRFLQLALDRPPVVIHGFEPSSVAFAELKKRFAGRDEVVLNQMALGHEAGEQMLYADEPGSELSSLYLRRIAHHNKEMKPSEMVAVNTLDHYCAVHEIARIDLLKLDVEGHELAVLRGATHLFERQQIAMVSFEFGGCNIDSRTYLRDFFEFFSEREMTLARVDAFGRLHAIPRYEEALEQFRTTCFVATSRRCY